MNFKILSIIVCSLLLQGCFYQTINHWDIERAAYFCNGIEAVVEITARFDGEEHVTCHNGDATYLIKVKIGEENNNEH
jgi:hypothetical protein